MLKFVNVSKMCHGKYIVKNISFHVERGEMAVLIGSSGCGKTTTLRMINRLIDPSEGTIRIGEKNSLDIDPVQLRLSIGYVTQKEGLIPHMTVAENIEIIPHLKGWKKTDRKARTKELLELVNLNPKEYEEKMPHQLSGGQQQRVCLARALAVDPEIILLDEPFSALDPINRKRLQTELKLLQERLKMTCVLVSHDMNEALYLGDKILFMHRGLIDQEGSPYEFIQNPANERVSRFFSHASRLNHADILPVKDIMLQDYPRILMRSCLYQAIELCNRWEEDFVIVTDDEGKYQGHLTVRECQKYSLHASLSEIRLQKTQVLPVRSSLIECMRQLQVDRRLLVIPLEDEEGRLVGVMTRESILSYIMGIMTKEKRVSHV